ncbi:NAD-dependent epimerase/dehydratase family protein [Lactococcus lactis]|uniref:NAD-dependent epimerase/dehydratase family protein n=1 Tax=Lactococcus lactis TaxID=1358 RepID=UPI00206D3628|nr:NAD-dependent epimerase/dehydratase family protein [Lactococcus lactis]BDH85015.1 putative NAD-dependent epimerase/dehydratase [Lactococcus lactis]
MKIFLTGATGFIGSRVLKELLEHGHQVTCLARSSESKDKIIEMGGEPVLGDLEALETIKELVRNVDAVIHLAFIHDFTNMEYSALVDKNFILTVGNELSSTNKSFLVTSALGEVVGNQVHFEKRVKETGSSRGTNEMVALDFGAKGVNVTVIRPAPIVYDKGHSFFLDAMFHFAEEKGISYYDNKEYKWSAINVNDLARLYRLAIEKGENNTIYHGVGEKEVSLKSIAQAIGRELKLPIKGVSSAELANNVSWLAPFVTRNIVGNNDNSINNLLWEPLFPSLLEELDYYNTTDKNF